MSDLADQAEGLRRIFGRRRARIVAICSSSGARSLIYPLASALAKLGQRVVLLTDHGDAPNRPTFSDLARRDYVADPKDCGNPITLCVSSSGNDPLRLSNFSPRAQSRVLDQLAAIQRRSDVVLIDAERTLSDALAQVREMIIVTTPRDESVLSAYAKIKAFSVGHHNSACRVYTVLDSAGEHQRGARAARNLDGTARRFLALQIEQLGSVDPREPATYQAIAEAWRGSPAKPVGEVAIEACIAHLFQPHLAASEESTALLLQ